MKTIYGLLAILILMTSCAQRTAPPAPVSRGYYEPSDPASLQMESAHSSMTTAAPSQPLIEQGTIQEERLPVDEEPLIQPQTEETQGKPLPADQSSSTITSKEDSVSAKAPQKKLSISEREKELEAQFSSLEETTTPEELPQVKKKPSPTKALEPQQADPDIKEEKELPPTDLPLSSQEELPIAHKKATESSAAPVSKFIWPVKGEIVSHFSQEKGKLKNDGINIVAPKNTPVLAVADGIVVYEGNEMQGFGNLILLKHSSDGWMSAYGHCSQIFVKRGQKVKKGDQIALVGDSGSVPSPQLHFQLRKKSTVVDPLQYLE